MPAAPLAAGQRIACAVERLAYGGRGVARVDGMAVFLDHALPGQKVEAVIERLKPRHAEARVERVLAPSADEVAPFCPHFSVCGGCDFQDLAYEAQLAAKKSFVAEALARVGNLADAPVLDTLASPRAQGFRNKMEFAFSGRGEELHLGLHPRGEGKAVFDVAECRLMDGEVGAWLAAAREAARELSRSHGLAAFDPSKNAGFWRFLVLRRNLAGEVMAVVVTSPHAEGLAAVRALADALGSACPGLVSVVHGTRRARSQVAQSEQTAVAWGRARFSETCGGVDYEFSPEAFFQTNTLAAERLFAQVASFAALTGAETLFDCCCGIGAMALALAPSAKQVVGFEVSREAVGDAGANAKRLGCRNCRFIPGDLAKTLLAPGLPRPDVVVTDPPRAGLDQAVTTRLIDLAPDRIVAVSCDPATLARDLSRLSLAYRVQAVQPVDLFPHSHHVETVALLVRR
ncbi:RNA methyltransferase, TrmA family [Desulfovibrio sp. X2]|uniref:23S rRNA (uracil(1939)-C(5))-methyltransferase RlmD n=1 Tax=Desulfovibrio sp. X2 TaxID=941449 RepID=UPI000358A07F|nr:23S rRNA (uracil(1939)-C(5))-methyltransferase RlmD [Desulfovibrio sp. X2]EPR39806.1 RNA methyltransferase, TrmA family [Desulfovibrio sp. X2]